MNLDLTSVSPLLDVLSEALVLLRDGRVSYHNAAASALFPGLAPGMPCPEALEVPLSVYESGGVATCTVSGRHYAVSIAPLGDSLVLSFSQIHDCRAGESQRLAAFTEQLREHMTRLLTATQQIESEARERGENSYDKWLAILNQSAYRLLRMTSAVELDRLLSSGEAYHPSTFDLAGLCHGLEMEIAPVAKEMGLTFTYETYDTSLLTTGDSTLLKHMLLGLISNAMKAVPGGGRLGLRLSRRCERAVLTVWDNGPGIDERSLTELFQSEPGEGGIPRPAEGLRLGLYNARRIAYLHGGVLVVESRQGEGARFTVSLPINPPDGLPLRSPKAPVDKSGGFSPLLVALSDALPWQFFLPFELE